MAEPTNAEIRELLERIDVDRPFDDVVGEIAMAYHLGSVAYYKFVLEGYEDVNVVISTDRGRYFLKIFRCDKEIAVVSDIIRVMSSLSEADAPVPRLWAYGSDTTNLIYPVKGPSQTAWACVMEYIDGDDFDVTPPTLEDIETFAVFLAKLHNLDFHIMPTYYDSWATANLLPEFDKKITYLSGDTAFAVRHAVDEFRHLDFEGLDKRIIHGDLHRRNALKARDGRHYVVDFGCIDYNYPIFDLGVFLALFCLGRNQPDSDVRIVRAVVEAYSSVRQLTAREIAYIPTLVRATYAVTALTAQYLIMVENDQSQQTSGWLEVAEIGLAQFTLT